MTIATTTNRIQYTGNGVTVNFAIGSPPFLFYSNSDIVVTATNLTTGVDTPWVLGTNYTITSSGNAQDGFTGTVVATVAPNSNTRITIERVVPYTQQTDYRDGSDSPANTFERSVDYLTMQTQQLNAADSFKIGISQTETGKNLTLPVARANKALVFDANGNVGVSTDDFVNVASNAAASAAAAASSAAAASGSAGSASTSASDAAASATTAATLAAGIVATSTTSLAIGTGSRTFTTQAGKQFQIGQWVTASSAANPANNMFGQVTSYSGTTLIVNVTVTGGSGTLADWNISLSGVRGATGPTGPSGLPSQTGFAGRFLQTDGTNPSWQNVAAGGLVLLSHQIVTAPVALVGFTSLITSTYDNYVLVASNVKVTSTGQLTLRFSTNNGAGYVSTASYIGTVMGNNSTSVFGATRGTVASPFNQIDIINNDSNYTEGTYNFVLRIYNPLSSNRFKVVGYEVDTASTISSNQAETLRGTGIWRDVTPANAFAILSNVLNITSGTFSLYGMAK